MIDALVSLGLVGIVAGTIFAAMLAVRTAAPAPDPIVLSTAQNIMTDARAAIAYDPEASAAFGAPRVIMQAGVACTASLDGSTLVLDCARVGNPRATAHLESHVATEAPIPGATVTPGA